MNKTDCIPNSKKPDQDAINPHNSAKIDFTKKLDIEKSLSPNTAQNQTAEKQPLLGQSHSFRESKTQPK
uniref:Uncharacterized protein n=1 Tax=Ditylenchus dipsaci TaxID=166011 RepID=A0A915DGE5_9BILA